MQVPFLTACISGGIFQNPTGLPNGLGALRFEIGERAWYVVRIGEGESLEIDGFGYGWMGWDGGFLGGWGG